MNSSWPGLCPAGSGDQLRSDCPGGEATKSFSPGILLEAGLGTPGAAQGHSKGENWEGGVGWGERNLMGSLSWWKWSRDGTERERAQRGKGELSKKERERRGKEGGGFYSLINYFRHGREADVCCHQRGAPAAAQPYSQGMAGEDALESWASGCPDSVAASVHPPRAVFTPLSWEQQHEPHSMFCKMGTCKMPDLSPHLNKGPGRNSLWIKTHAALGA